MYSEEQAKMKVCPNHDANCIASNCMAWRWLDAFDSSNKNTFYPEHTRTVEPVECLDTPFSILAEKRRGYCGLAGRPS